MLLGWNGVGTSFWGPGPLYSTVAFCNRFSETHSQAEKAETRRLRVETLHLQPKSPKAQRLPVCACSANSARKGHNSHCSSGQRSRIFPLPLSQDEPALQGMFGFGDTCTRSLTQGK